MATIVRPIAFSGPELLEVVDQPVSEPGPRQVTDAVDVGQGETLLLHGGAGGVGLMAIQLAVLRGARVIATASPRNHDLLRQFGAEPVAYGDGLADRVRALAPGGITAAGDLVGTE